MLVATHCLLFDVFVPLRTKPYWLSNDPRTKASLQEPMCRDRRCLCSLVRLRPLVSFQQPAAIALIIILTTSSSHCINLPSQLTCFPITYSNATNTPINMNATRTAFILRPSRGTMLKKTRREIHAVSSAINAKT